MAMRVLAGTVSGGPGQGQGGGDPLGRAFLVQRTKKGSGQRGGGDRPPGRGCGCSTLPLLALSIAIPLFSRLI